MKCQAQVNPQRWNADWWRPGARRERGSDRLPSGCAVSFWGVKTFWNWKKAVNVVNATESFTLKWLTFSLFCTPETNIILNVNRNRNVIFNFLKWLIFNFMNFASMLKALSSPVPDIARLKGESFVSFPEALLRTLMTPTLSHLPMPFLQPISM